MPSLVRNVARLTGIQICRGFNVHDLITCESKVQIASVGSYEVLFALGRHYVLTNDT